MTIFLQYWSFRNSPALSLDGYGIDEWRISGLPAGEAGISIYDVALDIAMLN